MPGKRVQFDQETWNALDLLARDSMRDFRELADEAFAISSASTAGRSTSRRPYAVFAPKGTPPKVVDKLYTEIK
jgi:hypothetical protein